MNKTILFITLLLLAGCVSEDAYTIGGVFHLTGAGSFWGESELNGALMAVEDINVAGGINGKNITMIVEDSATDFPATTHAFRKLIEVNEVEVIIGPTWFSQVVSPIAEETHTTIVSPSGGVVLEPNYYFFDVWPTERQEILPIVELLKVHERKNIVVLYDQVDWSTSMKNTFVEEAEKEGLTIISVLETTAYEEDYRTILAKIKKSGADAIYAPFHSIPPRELFLNKQKN